MKLGLPGSAGSVPTVLHDATDTGTDYILKHLILVGPKGGKMMPRTPKKCQNDAQGAQKSRKMNPGAPKGGPMRKRTIFWTYFPSHLGTHFDTFSPKDEQKGPRDDFFGRSRANTHFQ